MTLKGELKKERRFGWGMKRTKSHEEIFEVIKSIMGEFEDREKSLGTTMHIRLDLTSEKILLIAISVEGGKYGGKVKRTTILFLDEHSYHYILEMMNQVEKDLQDNGAEKKDKDEEKDKKENVCYTWSFDIDMT